VSSASLNLLPGNTDTTAPSPPVLNATTNPPSPSNSNFPRIQGTAEAGSTVRLYSNGFCTGLSVKSGPASDFTGDGIQYGVSDNSSNVISAKAYDTSGNVSGCTATATNYVEESVPPPVPSLNATDPASPSNDDSPLVKGTSPEADTTVRLYGESSCTEPAAVSGTKAQFEGAGIEIDVVLNQSNSIYAAARDVAGNTSACVGPITYIHDSVSGTPAITGTDPPSPANNNSPKLRGSGADADATILVYKGTACTGPNDGEQPASLFHGAGIPVSVDDNSSQTFVVEAYDTALNGSACSAPFTFTEDSLAPAAPALTSTDPASGSNENSPRFKGSAEAGSTVRLFATSDCSGTPAVTGTAAELAGPGLTVAVADNTTTELRARATDAAGNTSPCSAPVTYAEVTPVEVIPIPVIPGPGPGPGPILVPPDNQACAEAEAKLEKAKQKLEKAKKSGKKNRIKKAKAKVKKAKEKVAEACE
jgi:hypothetical protein